MSLHLWALPTTKPKAKMNFNTYEREVTPTPKKCANDLLPKRKTTTKNPIKIDGI
jgi:hypothetical protein